MSRREKSPRQRYAERVRSDVFQDGVTSAYIARVSGISHSTITSWRRNPGAMPAYQYLRLLDALGKGE